MLVATGTVAGLIALWAWNIAGFLNDPDEPRAADAIVVLGSDTSRVIEAADLYAAGLAPRVFLSHPGREPRFEALEAQGIAFPWFETAGRELLERRGVPGTAIATFGERLRSTAHEAETFHAHAGDIRSILLVSSPYHIYRARLIFRRALPGVTVMGIASRYEAFPRAWWGEADSARHAIMETVKLVFYLMGGRM